MEKFGETVCFIHKFGAAERPSSVFSIFPSSSLTSDLNIVVHPSAMSAFIPLLNCQMLQPETFQDIFI